VPLESEPPALALIAVLIVGTIELFWVPRLEVICILSVVVARLLQATPINQNTLTDAPAGSAPSDWLAGWPPAKAKLALSPLVIAAVIPVTVAPPVLVILPPT
jgi:hypothetical protein